MAKPKGEGNIKSGEVSPPGEATLNDFETDLDHLIAVVKRSRNKKLKAAFELYLDSFNRNLRGYLQFLRFQSAFQNIGQLQKEWTHSFERR